MKDFNLIISTVKRPNNSPYLDRLIASMRKEYKGVIHLVVGGHDTAYTDKYTKGFVKHYIADEEDKLCKTVFQKAALGYCRCLTVDPTSPCLVLEDDAVFIEGWYKKLKQLITFVPYNKYLLSLMPPADGFVPHPDIDIPSVQPFMYHSYLDYKVPGELPVTTILTYCNTSGIYYPVSLLKTSIAKFIFKFAAQGETVHDLAVGQFMFRYNLPVQVAVPNLLIRNVDSTDSHLGSEKEMSHHTDYSDWNYIKP